MSQYSVQLEVAGPLAMFTRPDTGGTPTSYPVPTWSAAKAIFESIAMLRSGNAWIRPTRVEVCKRMGTRGGSIKYQRYTTNYGGPERNTAVIAKRANMQLFATAIAAVCYRLYGEVEGDRVIGSNPRHHLYDLFTRRLERGQCYQTPSLGWREFTCSYWGAFRHEQYIVDEELTLFIPSMLFRMWDRPRDGQYSPVSVQNISIEKGALNYVE